MKFGCIIAPNSGSLNPNVGPGSSFSFGVINTFVRLHTKCTCTVKVVVYTGAHKSILLLFLHNHPMDLHEIWYDYSN